ncbi:MAG: alpha/beta hydrolase [Deltaproteobacteria bacterium]|nr:alpha/beta hydrolase [Deltaproteobacteria bacterium]
MLERIRTSDGIELRPYRWLVERPKIVVGLLHGYAEHCGRYHHVAETLNRHDVSVVGADLRGHGHSSGARGAVTRFTDYHADVEVILEMARRVSSEGAPVALLAHSMGGLLACHFSLSHPDAGVSALALSSPFLGIAVPASPVKLMAGRLLSRVWPKISLPSGLKGEDACADPDLARSYDLDPLVFPTVNARWFTEATKAIAQVLGEADRLIQPTLLLYGGADRIASADATTRFAAKLSMADREVERLDGCAHEIFNERREKRAEILERTARWLVARSGARDA